MQPLNRRLKGNKMLEKLLQLLAISCRHGRMSKPFATASESTGRTSKSDWESVTANSGGHYVVCLDCGRQFTYDWSKMRVMK